MTMARDILLPMAKEASAGQIAIRVRQDERGEVEVQPLNSYTKDLLERYEPQLDAYLYELYVGKFLELSDLLGDIIGWLKRKEMFDE